jgi:hypothetical protein
MAVNDRVLAERRKPNAAYFRFFSQNERVWHGICAWGSGFEITCHFCKDVPMRVQPSSKVATPLSQASESPSTQQIASAQKLLRSVLELPDEKEFLDLDERPSSRMLYSNSVTLWLLILQRLDGGKTLAETVSNLVIHGLELLPDNKRVRQGRVSENTSAYSRARTRLPLEYIRNTSERICNHLAEMSPGIIDGRRVFIIDGTTITLPPTPALRKAYPPATNQHGESVWPVAQLMIAAELQSGCVLLPQIDPMYGESNASEAEQARRIALKLPEKSIILADSGFGIYSVAHHSVAASHDILFRLSHTRFNALRRDAERIDEGPNHKSYHLLWSPSDKDRKTNPDLPKDAAIEVVLHDVKLADGNTLYLVSTLEIDADSAAAIYKRRYDIEFDIRDLKVTMDAENIRARSVDMVEKELYTSIVAYNLAVQFRRQAAKVAKVAPRKLSFKGIWTSFKDRLLMKPPCSIEEWTERFDTALRSAAKKKHPNRSHPRSYPRKAHPRRQKSTKFEKSLRQKKADENPEEPPK